MMSEKGSISETYKCRDLESQPDYLEFVRVVAGAWCENNRGMDVCFYCGVALSGWEEHPPNCPDCPHVKAKEILAERGEG